MCVKRGTVEEISKSLSVSEFKLETLEINGDCKEDASRKESLSSGIESPIKRSDGEINLDDGVTLVIVSLFNNGELFIVDVVKSTIELKISVTSIILTKVIVLDGIKMIHWSNPK